MSNGQQYECWDCKSTFTGFTNQQPEKFCRECAVRLTREVANFRQARVFPEGTKHHQDIIQVILADAQTELDLNEQYKGTTTAKLSTMVILVVLSMAILGLMAICGRK